jgi:hypothetical protein
VILWIWLPILKLVLGICMCLWGCSTTLDAAHVVYFMFRRAGPVDELDHFFSIAAICRVSLEVKRVRGRKSTAWAEEDVLSDKCLFRSWRFKVS